MKMKKFMLLFIGCLIVQGSMHAEDELLVAIDRQDLSAVNVLLQSGRCKINEPIRHCRGMTYLHQAVRYGTPAIVATLLAAGADVDAQDKDGRTALHIAAESGRHDCALILILAGGANVNKPDHEGKTPLHLAVIWGKLQAINVLLGAKANVDQPDENGWTPLHHAAIRKNLQLISILVKAGADMNRTDKWGNTLEDIVVPSHSIDPTELQKRGHSYF